MIFLVVISYTVLDDHSKENSRWLFSWRANPWSSPSSSFLRTDASLGSWVGSLPFVDQGTCQSPPVCTTHTHRLAPKGQSTAY